MSNCIAALMEAICKDQTTMSQDQITASNMALMDVTLQTNIVNYWTGGTGGGVLGQDARDVANAGKDDVAGAQAKYNAASSQYQAASSSADGLTQQTQQWVSNIGTNLQGKAQMAQTATTILSTTSGLLGRLLS